MSTAATARSGCGELGVVFNMIETISILYRLMYSEMVTSLSSARDSRRRPTWGDLLLTFRHAGLTVRDIDRSLRFWVDGLGLEIVAEQDQRAAYLARVTGEPGAHTRQALLRFPGGEAQIELLQYVEPEGTPVVLRPRDPGGGHVAVTCSLLDPLVTRLLAHGGRPQGERVELDSGINRGAVAVYIRDPDDHIVEIVQPPCLH